jgi:hypothetical protein
MKEGLIDWSVQILSIGSLHHKLMHALLNKQHDAAEKLREQMLVEVRLLKHTIAQDKDKYR